MSLIYHVRIDSKDSNPLATLNQVISVLKERVNPKGLLDISMQPLGLDRIEIVMPLPSQTVLDLRRDYQVALEALLKDAQIEGGKLQTALAARTAVEEFGREGMRGDQIEKLQAAYDRHQSAADRFESAQPSDATPSEIGTLAQAVADALLEFEEQLAVVLKLSLERVRLERALRLSTDPQQQSNLQGGPITDSQTGMPVMGPSPREAELDAITQEFGLGSERLEELVESYDGYAAKRRGFDDPEDLMRLLRGAGVLEFRIAVDANDPQGVNPNDLRTQLAERGAANTDSSVARFFQINDLSQWYDTPDQLAALQADPVTYFRSAPWNLVAGERDLKYYLLLYTTDDKTITHEQGRTWSVVGTSLTVDNLGRDAVLFRLDAPGGAAMRRLTSLHVNDPMAIVLDGQVYSAPNIVQSIGSSGIITGSFSQAEVNYLTRVLAAGSLKARLTPDPIAINTLGPSIGQDNLVRGLKAFVVALIAVALFMMAYYFFAGMVADLALLANGVIIFGFMAMIDGTFTLPGLAGIVLTIGMAVDANVLIYERIREELVSGEVDLRGAIKLGYAKALPTIIDANVTNLIICVVLYYFATTEVKGFALTLGIGIVATLITALFVTRVIYELYTDIFGFKRLNMLPTVVPAIHRMLAPNIGWMGMRKVFWTFSILAVIGSISLVSIRGIEMFDTEFRGGVAATMLTVPIDADGDGQPDKKEGASDVTRLMLPHTGIEGVEQRIHHLAEKYNKNSAEFDPQANSRFRNALAASGSDLNEQTVDMIIREFAIASVLTVGETENRDGVVYASGFQVKVPNAKGLPEEKTISDVIIAAVVTE
ncbi:MAG: protein translocase subunit SecD, partial [Planctomycetes bacterium]|nr:protein translocase subunit SecD [Planctomycetota bacterium]